MATTKIWDVRGRMDHVIDYVNNAEKTENVKFSCQDLQGLRDVMDYMLQDYKTEQQYYVTGLNCQPQTARQEMMITKKQFQKEGGIIAYHGYQSFMPGEVTPQQAHDIGVKLAEELWGARFEVIVATHLDKSHIHNHFVLNSVSFVDGYRYYDNNASYDLMRKTSDRLCREHQLSVIEHPETGRRPNYEAYLARQEGKPTWRDYILADIEKSIARSVTISQFFHYMMEQGYEIKTNRKYFTLRPLGKERFVRIDRKNPEYSLENIQNRILKENHKALKHFMSNTRAEGDGGDNYRKIQVKGKQSETRKIGGFRGLCLHYCYLLGVFQKPSQRNQREMPLVLKEDVRKMERIFEETKLLCRMHIDTAEQLDGYQAGLKAQMQELGKERNKIRCLSRKVKDAESLEKMKKDIAELTRQISGLRKEERLCNSIRQRSKMIKEKIAVIKTVQYGNKEEKERDHNEYVR